MPLTATLNDPGALLSPSLILFRDRIERNLESMITLAGSPERLRPHVKTHKMPALVRMLEDHGIHKHKCATIAEAEMIARARGGDVLLAFPLVGPNLKRICSLVAAYPATTFRAVVDDPESARALSTAVIRSGGPNLPVLIDLDVGMGRTGIDPARAYDLASLVRDLPGLTLDGLHAYDGHIRVVDPHERERAARPGIDATLALRERLTPTGSDPLRLVLGGTPTFPIHAALEEPGVECSPGTCILHDANYRSTFPDLPFEPAALLLTRVISRPRDGQVCLDLGHKAVAADPPLASRLRLQDHPDLTIVSQSEEHLVIQIPANDKLPIGTTLLAVPGHICPTCALHSRAYVVEDGVVIDEWEVAARDRVIGV